MVGSSDVLAFVTDLARGVPGGEVGEWAADGHDDKKYAPKPDVPPGDVSAP